MISTILLAAALQAATICEFQCPDTGSASNDSVCRASANGIILVASLDQDTVQVAAFNGSWHGVLIRNLNVDGYGTLGDSAYIGGSLMFRIQPGDPVGLFRRIVSGETRVTVNLVGDGYAEHVSVLTARCDDCHSETPEPGTPGMLGVGALIVTVIKMRG